MPTVTLNCKDFADKLAPPAERELCQPANFCKWDTSTSTCKSNLTGDPLLKVNPGLEAEADHVCETWVVKQLDRRRPDRVQRKPTVSGEAWYSARPTASG